MKPRAFLLLHHFKILPVSYIRDFGGRSTTLHEITKRVIYCRNDDGRACIPLKNHQPFDINCWTLYPGNPSNPSSFLPRIHTKPFIYIYIAILLLLSTNWCLLTVFRCISTTNVELEFRLEPCLFKVYSNYLKYTRPTHASSLWTLNEITTYSHYWNVIDRRWNVIGNYWLQDIVNFAKIMIQASYVKNGERAKLYSEMSTCRRWFKSTIVSNNQWWTITVRVRSFDTVIDTKVIPNRPLYICIYRYTYTDVYRYIHVWYVTRYKFYLVTSLKLDFGTKKGDRYSGDSWTQCFRHIEESMWARERARDSSFNLSAPSRFLHNAITDFTLLHVGSKIDQSLDKCMVTSIVKSFSTALVLGCSAQSFHKIFRAFLTFSYS